jgi:hypothetical protein
MAKTRLLILVCVWALTPGSARAQDGGGWIEWLEKMSGPGPFWGAGAYVRFYCIDKDHRAAAFCRRSPDRYPDARPGDERHLFEFRVGNDKSFDGKPRFFDTPDDTRTIHILRIDARYYYRFHDALDVGFGFGLRRYSGEDSGDFSPFTRWSVTPAAIVFVPGALGSGASRNPWRRFVKLQLEESLIGGISAARDFKSASRYETDGELLSGVSIEFDALVFLERRRR